jgi:signal transduction histidine kinase
MHSATVIAAEAGTPAGSRPAAFAVAALAGCAAVAVSVAIALSGAAGHPILVASARALIVGAPVAVGLYAWYRWPEERFGRVLVAAGAAWFVTTLAESDDATVYSIGRAAGWVTEVVLVYLTLAFPTGRLPTRTDRLLVAAIAVVVLVIYMPRLFVAREFEVPSPFTSCVHDCSANAFFVLDQEPALVDDVVRPVGVVMVFLVMTGVVLRLIQRRRAATPLTRRMLGPVVAVTAVRAGVLGVAIVARQIDSSARSIEVAAWLLALAIPVIALAFLAGLLRWRLFAGDALQQLTERVRDVSNAVTLRGAFADAFKDPTLEIVLPADGSDAGWLDSGGRPVTLPGPGTGRCVSEIRIGGRLVAALVHDEGLRARPELVRAGVAVAGVVLDNQRLAAHAEASIRELRRSRARLASSAVRERRRIERDLHDGAQQRLVALRIELEVAEDLIRGDPERGVARLHELETQLDDALEELRSLAHGVYPPLLADRGLDDGLRAAAERSAIPVELDLHDLGRYPPEIESAVYFCVLEALQNVLKHAGGAHRVVVCLDGSVPGELRFAVVDDGAGAAALSPGAGITNMKDRLAAVGGEVTLTSTVGVGTKVRGWAPVSPQADT